MTTRDWALTHAGTVRPYNEDALVCCAEAGLWAVADGAGGHQAGDVASTMIATALGGIPAALSAEEALSQVRLRLAVVHDALHDRAAREQRTDAVIASTVVVLLVRDGHFACLWAGDSRAYLLRDGALVALTRDHSLVQQLVDAGSLTADQAERHPHANVITRAVGDGEDVLNLDKVTGAVRPGDRFLLCSDGLTKALNGAAIAAGAATATPAVHLVDAALAAGARDNVTAVVIEIDPV
jgi:protein phosphatase/serine/threonine-protein phosphatase Stp1